MEEQPGGTTVTTCIVLTKLNMLRGINPQAWMTDLHWKILRKAGPKQHRLEPDPKAECVLFGNAKLQSPALNLNLSHISWCLGLLKRVWATFDIESVLWAAGSYVTRTAGYTETSQQTGHGLLVRTPEFSLICVTSLLDSLEYISSSLCASVSLSVKES